MARGKLSPGKDVLFFLRRWFEIPGRNCCVKTVAEEGCSVCFLEFWRDDCINEVLDEFWDWPDVITLGDIVDFKIGEELPTSRNKG